MLLIPLFQAEGKTEEMPLAKCCLAVLAEKKGKHQLPLPVGEIVRNVGKVPRNQRIGLKIQSTTLGTCILTEGSVSFAVLPKTSLFKHANGHFTS